jgi:DNA-binding IclR family transcriptional regulator
MEARTKNTLRDTDALSEELRLIRDRGFATDNCEFMDDMIAVAVPILDFHGRLVSTLSFHAPEQRLPLEQAIDHIGTLKEAAQQLSNLISEDLQQSVSAQ